jgi:ABC-type amino acid transport substrate-binding protein
MKNIIFSLLLLLVTALPVHAESVYDRVMKNGTIKCGYIPYPPALIVDPNTGTLSGVFYDFMNEIGARLSLKVEWVQESGWGTFIDDLKSDRYDMMCSAVWKNAARAREVAATQSIYFSAITAWVRSDDKRFDKNLSVVNSPEYIIGTVDGETAALIAKTDYPKAKVFSLPENSAVSDMALNVSSHKADLTFLEKYIAIGFLKTNPGTLKEVGKPQRVYGNAMFVKRGEDDFRLMIDTVIEELLNSNYLPGLLKKYDVPADSYLSPAPPYEGSSH